MSLARNITFVMGAPSELKRPKANHARSQGQRVIYGLPQSCMYIIYLELSSPSIRFREIEQVVQLVITLNDYLALSCSSACYRRPVFAARAIEFAFHFSTLLCLVSGSPPKQLVEK